MNIITSQIQQSKSEIQEMVCQIHKQEIVAIDLDTQEKGSYQYLCCNCLVEKMNNNKISTIEQTKDRIQALKTQRQENKIKEIQVRLDNFKIIQEQIMEFKCNVENNLEKIYSQIKAQIFTIQKEQQSLLDNFQIEHNFQEEVKSLSEFLSTETSEKQLESYQDSQFIDEIAKQFDLLFNSASYFQTIDTFKNCKQKMNEINQKNQIELMSLQNTNSQKTPSLNKICSSHNKEIIMIDIDSKLKKIEERFACVDCISDHPNCQYRTIEKINQQWNHAKKQQDRIFSDLKIKRQEKQEKLNQQISIMRKNYNQQLNEISEKLITEFSLPISKPIEINKFKQTSLQQLSNEELLQNINQIILNEKENLVQDSKIEYLKSKETLFQKEIENKLEHLKQHDQLDIQESINILKDAQNDSQIQRIVQLQQQIYESTKANQEQLILKQDLDELINSSKYIYCQKSLLNESIQKFQEHLTKIQTFGSKMQQIPDNLLLANLNTQTNDYKNTFEKDFQQFMKFCEIENLEKNFETLQQDYKKLQLERNQQQESIEKDYKLKIQKQNDIIEELKQLVKDTEFKLKQKVDQEQLLNEKLKEENANNAKFQLKLNDQQVKHDNEIKSLNEKINQSKIQINKIQNDLDIRIKASIFLDIKPSLLEDNYWIYLFFKIQDRTKMKIMGSELIYRGSRDGLNHQAFWSKCNKKNNLLMLFKSKSNYICGGYSPCTWNKDNRGDQVDSTNASFLFSQTHNQIYELIIEKNNYAIKCLAEYGPIFGNDDIVFGDDLTSNKGYGNFGCTYKCDQYSISNKKCHLFGQEQPLLVECEIYQINLL